MLAPRFVRTLRSLDLPRHRRFRPGLARKIRRKPKPGFSPAQRSPASMRSCVKTHPGPGAWRRRLALRAAAASVGRWVECHLPAGTVGRIDGRKRGFRNRTDRGLERSAPASNEANTPSGARRLWPNAGTGSDALGPNHAGSAF